MIRYKLTFGSSQGKDIKDAEDIVVSYLVYLERNGQIERHDYDRMISRQGQVVAFVEAYGPTAWQNKYHSKTGLEGLAAVSDFFGTPPVWEIYEDSPPKREVSWKNASALCLYGGWDTDLYREDTKKVVPLYLLPLTDEQRDAIYCWKTTYMEYYPIWFSTGKLEILVYREFAEPHSELSRMGRECCRNIEAATGIPTYYFLKRYYGYEIKQEKKRKCPCCGKPWCQNVKDNAHLFDFKCNPCRLVSDFGVDGSSPRYAKIGDYIP